MFDYARMDYNCVNHIGCTHMGIYIMGFVQRHKHM